MSTRAQRRERAQERAQGLRTVDPVADRLAARDAIAAEYDVATTEAFEEAARIAREANLECSRKIDAAWEERCRKLGELEEREIPPGMDEEAIKAAKDRGAGRLAADLKAGESIGAQQERADIEESGL